MSLQPISVYLVPAQTARVARAAFPKPSLSMRIYDQLGTIFQDEDFADLFPPCGQPAQAPFCLALITILQFLEGLSDRAAADAVRGRIDWKYLLCLELDDSGVDYSVLCEFRTRLLAGGAERRLFDKLLALLREHKLVKARSRQRTDSTRVVAAVRDLNRLKRVVETLRATLNVLATVEPNWLRANIPVEWLDRYEHRAEENRMPAEEKEREELAEVVGRDGYVLLDAIWSDETPEWMRGIPAIEICRRVWVQNFMPVAGGVQWRRTDNVPPSSLRVSSPYDTEARYAYKRSTTTWVGYKVHLSETCDEEGPHIITNVHTEEALVNDNDALPKIHDQLARAELLPHKHLVDGGYVEATQLVESRRAYGVELIGPVHGNGRWQLEQGTGFDISHFKIDWEREQAQSPAGKTSSSWKAGVDGRGNDVINVALAKADCLRCPSLSQCTKSKTKRRTLNIKPRELHEALQQARQREKTKEFQEEYSKRAGVEGTISQGVRAFGMRRSRYIGKAKTHLQHLATAAAINIERVADWFAGERREETRRSAFARAMMPLAA